jgi:glutamyl-tRNA reductase
MGTSEAIAHAQQRLNSHSAAVERITIVGGGDVGFRLAQRLEQRGDADVWVIERDQARGEHLAAVLKHALVLVSVIDNDERNLDAANLRCGGSASVLPYPTDPESGGAGRPPKRPRGTLTTPEK